MIAEQKERPGFSESLAEDSGPGLDDAAALPRRLVRYAKAHERALDMADFIAEHGSSQYKNLPGTLRECGHYLLFRDYFTVGKIRLSAACFCKKHLLCPLCAIRRGAKLLKSYHQRLQALLRENPDLKPYLVTLTVKNGPDLAERYEHLNRSLKKMTQARRNAIRGKGPWVQMAYATAAVWSFEFKKGKGRHGWHPHTHGVWMCEEGPDAEKLADEWHKITGDSFIVDVRPFHTDQDAIGGFQDVIGGFLEVFKYAVKFSDLPLADNFHGYEILRGRRMVASLGDFRGIEIPEDLTDELLEEDLPYVEIVFQYRKGAGYTLRELTSA